MLSSLVKHIWLIQPGEAPFPARPIDAAGGATVRMAPAWDLLCLQAYLRQRTGHTCALIDVRIHDHLDQSFSPHEKDGESPPPALALIHAGTHHLPSVREITGYLRGRHPNLPIALAGPHISSFPETLAFFPEITAGLRGDPEPILRLFLDALDIPHRLKMVPGLVTREAAPKPAHWLPDLKALCLPEWDYVRWGEYHIGRVSRGAHAEVRLSRGHPRTPEDQAWPTPDEPVRPWPMNRMAQLLQKCSGNGISEVFFNDPPGFWSDKRLLEWCTALRALRNTQAWSFHLMARGLPDEIIAELALNGCRRMELIIPALDSRARMEAGMVLTDSALKDLIAGLKRGGIDPQLVYWIEGPHGALEDASAIMRHVSQMGSPAFAVYPHPMHYDAPLYTQIREQGRAPPSLNQWMSDIFSTGLEAPCWSLWTGTEGVHRARQTMTQLHRRIIRNPARLLRKLMPSAAKHPLQTAGGGWFERLKNKLTRNRETAELNRP